MITCRSEASEALSGLPEWVADKRRELATDNVNRSYEAALALLKWVLTSSLVLHSTALIAAFGSSNFAKILLAGPAWIFLAGVGFTIGGGLILAFSAAQYAGQMSEALWNGRGLDGEDNDVFDPKPTTTILVGASLLGLSIACFMLGTGFSALAITAHVEKSASVQVKNK